VGKYPASAFVLDLGENEQESETPMWTNFKEMPLILKVLTVNAVACGGFLLGSVVPGLISLFMWIPVPALALPGPGPNEFLFVVFAFLYLTGSEAVREYFAIEVTKGPAGNRLPGSPGTPARDG
jgi:hypothetical protein